MDKQAPRTSRIRWLAVSGLTGRTMMAVALIVMAIAAADRSQLRLDLSSDHRFTIDPALRTLLAQQHEKIALVGIWGSEDERTTDVLTNDLQQMSHLNPVISWQHIDPNLNRPQLEDFASHHGGARTRGLYVVRDPRLYAIPVNDSTRLSLQRDLGAALQVLNEDAPRLAVFLQGHGELRPGGGPGDGCDACITALKLGGFNYRIIDSSTAEQVPANALLIIAGPKHALSPAGITIVSDHVRDGGGVLACLDDQAPLDLCAYLHQRGILVGTGYPQALGSGDFSSLLDPAAPTQPGLVLYSWTHNFTGDGHSFPYPNLLLENSGHQFPMINTEHQASAAVALSGVAVLSPETSQVEALSLSFLQQQAPAVAERWGASGLAPERTTRLMNTLPGDAWRQRFGPDLHQPPGWDTAAPYGVAWAVEFPADSKSVQDGQGGRMVVWGSRQALSDNALSHTAYANADLLRSLASWLVRRSPISTIPDTQRISYHANLSERGLFYFIFLMVLILPGLTLGAAMLTWWDRR